VGTPTAERVVKILDFLTTHPGRGFTVSEIARRLRLSKATTHKILGTLADSSYVIRTPDTFEYRLGPALLPMGHVAERNLPAVTYAMREAERLADEHDSECVVVVPSAEELLIVYHAGIPGPLSAQNQQGQRQPFAPPLGTAVLAWRSAEAVEAWLNRSGSELAEEERARYRAAIAAVRRRGYAITQHVPSLIELQELWAHADVHTPHGRGELSRALQEFAHEDFVPDGDDPPPEASVSAIAAPVFGPDEKLLLLIGLLPSQTLFGRRVHAVARDVLRAAGRVTKAIHGRAPASGGGSRRLDHAADAHA
jgi:DNA-binding IclR family transcriptional regulator